MADTIVEKQACRNCAAEVRPDTLFCYNCGKSVAPEIVEDLPPRKNVSDGWFRESVVDVKNEKKDGGQKQPIVVKEKNEQPVAVEENLDPPVAKSSVPVIEPELKSAATMRRRKKTFQPKRVEIIWEEHESAPNVWFIIAAVLLALFAAGILYLAMSLK